MQKNDSRMVYAYFSILYFLNMSSRALFTPFFTVYLQEKGAGRFRDWNRHVDKFDYHHSLSAILGDDCGSGRIFQKSAGLLLPLSGGGSVQL